MTPEFLSRLQFALTASFHFIFPPISIGLGAMLVWMGWRYLRTRDPVWRQSAAVVVWMIASGYGIPRAFRAHAGLLALPAGAIVAGAIAGAMVMRGRDVSGYFWSAAAIALLLVSLAADLYPDLLTSSINPGYSMTVSNATADGATLTVMLIIAAIGIPFVLLYTAGVQYVFRGKVRLTGDSY